MLNALSRLFTSRLQAIGFTCGMDDLLLTPAAEAGRSQVGTLSMCQQCVCFFHGEVTKLWQLQYQNTSFTGVLTAFITSHKHMVLAQLSAVRLLLASNCRIMLLHSAT